MEISITVIDLPHIWLIYTPSFFTQIETKRYCSTILVENQSNRYQNVINSIATILQLQSEHFEFGRLFQFIFHLIAIVLPLASFDLHSYNQMKAIIEKLIVLFPTGT